MIRLMMFAIMSVGMTALCGCNSGPRMFDVSGTVTIDGGKSVKDGEILFDFIPTAEHAWGPDHARIKDGQFKLKVKEGKHRVRIISDAPIPGTKNMYGDPLTKNIVDAKYNMETTLTADVGEGKTTFTFEVKSAPPGN